MTDDRFTDAPISRRQFVRLSAATGAALSLPGTATAAVDAPSMDDEYRYVQSHTPADHAVPTLVELDDAASFEAVEAIATGTRTTTDPRPAAHARLTATEAEAVAALPTAETLHFSPGANPFWRLGYYPFGVFPEPDRSADYIDYEELLAGLEQLADEHDDRLRLDSVGRSHGKYNQLSDRVDPRQVPVVELSADVDDREAFAAKDKVLVNCSIHGDERAGAEAGARFVEQLLRGEEPAVEALLSELALVFVFTNPDGWAARRPQYESYGVPGAPLHERGNAGGDSNRQFPNPGWVSAAHTIAEPLGRTLDGETPPPEEVRELVPDTLGFIEHCREYDNLVCGADLHGMLNSQEFVLGLDGATLSDAPDLHDRFEMMETIDDRMSEALSEWETAGEATADLPSADVLPDQAFDFGTPVECIGYSGTGFADEWMAFPEELGGLDMTGINMEIAYSNLAGGNVYTPAHVGMQVAGYQAGIRAMIDHATKTVDARVEIDGDVGYVTTEELTRSSEDLSFLGEDGGGDTATATRTTSTTIETEVPADGTATVTHDAAAGLHSLTVHPHVPETATSARLRDPDGTVVRSFDADEGRAFGGACCALPTWQVTAPAAGEWTLQLSDALGEASTAEVEIVAMQAGEHPDPREALGYEQRPYEVTPLAFFEELDAAATGDVDPLTPTEVARGGGNPVSRRYDHLVVIHDDAEPDGPNFDADDYLAGLDTFVQNGGNLVVTDTAVELLPDLDAVDLAGDDVYQETRYVARLDEIDDEHPLVTDRRPIEDHLWYIAPIGYAEDQAPITFVDSDAFEAAGGAIAGTRDGDVVLGSVDAGAGSVQVVGSLLRPATQTNLHPFGMVDYSVTFFGQLVLTNALGAAQVRLVDGEETRSVGVGRQ